MAEAAAGLAGSLDDVDIPKPGDLTALVRALGAWRENPEGSTNFIVVSVASALPETKRSETLIEQLQESLGAIAVRKKGQYFMVSDCDIGLIIKLAENSMIGLVRDLKVELLRTIERNHPGSFGSIDQTRLVTSYDLSQNYRSAADRVSRYAEQAKQKAAEGPDGGKKLRPLTQADIKNVMRAYEKFGTDKFVKTFVRSQNVIKHNKDKDPQIVMREFFISMDLLRKPLFVDVEMRGSGRLFNEFTQVLDQILLQAFSRLYPGDMRVSLNLNVESVFTEAFEVFLEETDERTLRNVVFEFRQANIVENFDEFQVARGLIRSKGAHIAVDQIFPQTVGLVDIEYLGASMAKVHWRAGAQDMLFDRQKALKYMIDCGVHPVLIRVDSEDAMDTGNKLGIEMYQGFLIDKMAPQT